MKNYTENTAYNRYLYKIAHSYSKEMLEEIKFEIVCDVEINTFEMVNDLCARCDRLADHFI